MDIVLNTSSFVMVSISVAVPNAVMEVVEGNTSVMSWIVVIV